MGLFHRATITPTKAELIADWAPTQPWCPTGEAIDVLGAFRLDDPDNQVGMEVHLATAGDTLLQVPLTYRNEPLDDAEHAFIGEMEHSELGTRHVYDGLGDQRFLMMAAGAAMTGQGEALGLAVYDGRWYVAPANVRIQGGGWTQERVAVDRFEAHSDDGSAVSFANERFELTVFRRPAVQTRPPMGLSATWDGQTEPVLLAVVGER